MSPDPYAIAAVAAQGFKNLECFECMEAVRTALIAAGISGEVIQLRVLSRRGYMICFSYDAGSETITETGIHVAVRLGDMMFDNLHPAGMTYEEWKRDFDAHGGIEDTLLERF